MDYAIYKTHDGKYPNMIYRFTQQKCNHRAKKAAETKLHEMWLRVATCTERFRNASYNNLEFSYDLMTSATTKERIRFYIDRL
ncbi:MAG: hypothetical protein NC344_05775 [Bacteroidales bacterium]|nr:hypothetical protein [Bacteroidales bacterium]MCM1147328.1 hypothetical protein [Bacteroidales bacterium]MCM1206238.1 hypothetical protein [Bacillota bacterium]